MNKILLIGGEGYIGNIIAQNFIDSGYNIISYDNLIYKNNYCVLNKIHSKQYKFIHADILNRAKLEFAIKEAESVILLAGLVGDPITKKYPKESAMINDKGVKNVIDLCAKNNLNNFIFVSTCSNYGLIEDSKLADENHELNPLSLYAKSKVDAEKYILSLKGRASFNPTILRFSTAFGLSPRMRFDLTISEFTRDISLGKELLVYDAQTWRPYCHVQDFSRLIKMVIEAPKEKVSWEIFNAGGNVNNATKKMIVDFILQKIPEGKVTYQDKGNDPRNYKVNFEKVRSILGFKPFYTIQDGIDELINAINNHTFDFTNKDPNLFGNYEINYPSSQ